MTAPKPKQRAKQPATQPGRNGGRLLAGGKPGNKGGSGRPPSDWKAKMAEALDRAEAENVVKTIIADPKAKPADRLKAIEFAASYAEGKPSQPVAHEGEVRIVVVDETE